MDINDFRAWHTLILLISFVAIVLWAYSKRRKAPFDEAAHLPFADDQQDAATIANKNSKKENEA